MPANSLPPVIEPVKWADRATPIVADVPLAKFARLAAEAVQVGDSVVHVDCRLERDRQRMVWLRGAVSAEVLVTCQRCLEPVQLPLSVELALALLPDEAAAERLPDDADYIVVEEQISITDILEDELLLTIPYIPMHDDCDSVAYRQPQADATGSRKENPFQVLAALKKPTAED